MCDLNVREFGSKVVGWNYHQFESNGISKDLDVASGPSPGALKCNNLLGPPGESSLKCVHCPGIICDLATPLLECHAFLGLLKCYCFIMFTRILSFHGIT